MQSRDFVYWLQGFFELSKPTELNAEQTLAIRNHLAMVFVHEIDPAFPEKEKLQEIHNEPDGNAKVTSPLPRSISVDLAHPFSPGDIKYNC